MRKERGIELLFLLTGDVRIGKTRWLEGLCAELSDAGTRVAGVVAPGVWRTAGDGDGFEKLGIDNVLLPGGERVPFARRRDLALAEGVLDPKSQSEAARLGWHISDDALARVNAHFEGLARARGARGLAGQGLLVVDELGRLELEHDGGLTAAMALLTAGPASRFAHALVVVRDGLCPLAEERFGAAWGGATRIAPDDEALSLLRSACGLPPCAP